MAKRSDFAQKLLDDLRLRKERMAASQRSSQSHKLSKEDAYAYSKLTNRRSTNTKASEIVSSRTGDVLNKSSRSHRSANNGEISYQLVPYGRGQGQSSLKMNDMSLAVAFAYENGGKLRADSSYNSSTMAFLHQIKRGTMEFSMMERQGNLGRQQASINNFQALSPVQINQISKGAQKLNQILKACYNGLNIDRYSIEFAKELFQGAIDLEESLKMLVDLQKSSEFMITPQKKNRITLLDEESDDDDKIIKLSEQKQLARPNFSFDKPLRQTPMQRQINLTNSKEGRNSNKKKHDGKTSKASDKQPTSSSTDMKNLKVISEQKDQSASVQSNPQKGRIPNVIAKLMGLDNLPGKVEPKDMPQKGYTQKIGGSHGMTSQHTAKEITKKTELHNKHTQNLVAMKKQNVIEAFNMPAAQDEELMFSADKNLLTQKASTEAVVRNGKPLWRDLDGIKALKGFEKPTIKIDKQHNSASQMILVSDSQKNVWVKARKQDPANNKEQKSTGNSRTKDPAPSNMLVQLEQVNERSEVKPSLREEKEINGSNFQSAKRHTNKHTMNTQKKSQNNLGVQKSYMLSKYRPEVEKQHGEQRIQQSEKQMLLVRPQGGSELTSKNSSKAHHLINSHKKHLNQTTSFKQNFAENIDGMKLEGFLSSHNDDLVRHDASNDTNEKAKEIINRKSGSIITMVDEKSVHKLANMKVKNIRKQKVDRNGKIEGLNGRKLFTTQVEQQIHILQESRQGTPDRFNVLKEAERERVGMFKEADARIISSNKSVAGVEDLDERHPPRKEAELPPTLYNCDGGEIVSPKRQAALAPSDLYQYMQSGRMDDLQDHAAPAVADEEFKTGEVASNTMKGIHEERLGITNHSQLQDQNISEKGIQGTLTESENCLKWILVMSQSFLNTAEELFRLNIPFSILQGGGQDNQGEGRKLLLDCGYEVMKRKGILNELKVHPCSKKISMSTINIRSLDDLVRQLNKDMEKLKFYGRNRGSQVGVEDYLPKMLEHDVYNRDPDIDCMWDFSWNDETFAFIEKYDVIREAEKHILNVLLNEITGELLHVQGGLKMTTIQC